MQFQTRCILSKPEEVETNVEEEEEAAGAVKEENTRRNGATRAGLEPTTLPTAGTVRTTSGHENTRTPATTAETKGTLGLTVLSGKRHMLHEIIGLLKSMKETDADEETDLLPTPLSTENDSQGLSRSAQK